MKKKKLLSKSVTGKVLLGLLLLGTVLSAAVSSFVGISYYNDMMNVGVEELLCDELMLIYDLDIDKLRNYIETNEADEYYYEVVDKLKYHAYNWEFLYIYVFYIDDASRTVYVYDSGEYGMKDGAELGTSDVMPDSLGELYRSQWYDYDFIVSEDEYAGYTVTTFTAPIYDDDGSTMAYLAVDIDTKRAVSMALKRVFVIALICISIVAAAIVLAYLFFKKHFAEPIEILKNEVKDTAQKLDSGETINLNIKTGDEIEELSHVFENMYVAMQFYMEDVAAAAAEKEHMEAELSIATEIQSSMLPRQFPVRPEFRIFATMTPAKEVGGDFYDFFMVDESHLAFVVADVSGKGVPAALFMVIAKTLIKDHTEHSSSVNEVFSKVNDILIESDERGMFVTAFEGVLDLKTGEVVFVNAGHEPPFVRTKEGFSKFKTMPGLVLSCMPGTQYKAGTLQLSEGDAIFQYTDGVTEATDAHNELYGLDRLEAVLNANTDKSASELLPAVKADIDAFVGSAPQFDDITMLCLEFTEKMK